MPKWTNKLNAALIARREAGEGFDTISRDFGKSKVATRRQYQRLVEPTARTMRFDSQPFSVPHHREQIYSITVGDQEHKFQIYVHLLPGFRYVIDVRSGRSFIRALRVGEEYAAAES